MKQKSLNFDEKSTIYEYLLKYFELHNSIEDRGYCACGGCKELEKIKKIVEDLLYEKEG